MKISVEVILSCVEVRLRRGRDEDAATGN